MEPNSQLHKGGLWLVTRGIKEELYSREIRPTPPRPGDQGRHQQWWVMLTVWTLVVIEEKARHLFGLPSRNPYPGSNHERNIDKHQLRAILQHTWPALLQTVTVIEDKQSLRTCHSPEELKGTWRLNAVWDPGIESGHYGNTEEIWIMYDFSS